MTSPSISYLGAPYSHPDEKATHNTTADILNY